MLVFIVVVVLSCLRQEGSAEIVRLHDNVFLMMGDFKPMHIAHLTCEVASCSACFHTNVFHSVSGIDAIDRHKAA